tara:strand:+ start:236 stop:409 length:174 start_codon:yes stop_codon:yes gene_type:complete
MFLIDVAEWCVEALVLSLAFFFFAIGFFTMMMVVSVCKQAWQSSNIKQKLEDLIKNA